MPVSRIILSKTGCKALFFLFSLIIIHSNNLDLSLFRLILLNQVNNAAFPRIFSLALLASFAFSGLLLSFIFVLFKERVSVDKKRVSEKLLVLLNLLPLILYLFALGGLALLSTHNANVSQGLKNTLAKGGYETLQSFERQDINEIASFENVRKEGDSLTPTALNPRVTLSFKNSFVDQGLYAIIKFGGINLYPPQVFWSNDKDFSIKKADLSPVKLADNTYLFRLKEGFMGLYFGNETKVKYLRLVPTGPLNAFQINKIEIIKL